MTDTTENSAREQQLLDLSRDKWRWMAERDVEQLDRLVDPQAIFVHMGGTFSKAEELGIIEAGTIQYKHADVHEASVRFIGSTAIVLSKMHLTAVVAGNEVVNPFSCTEVFIEQGEAWQLGALAFTRLLGD